MLGDIFSIVDTGTSAAIDAIAANGKAREALTETEYLKFKIEKLMIVTEALWLILKEKNGLSDEDLKNIISQIDTRDGKEDGKVASGPPEKCAQCGRTLPKKGSSCIYCGVDIETDVFKR